jgi:hypothetical protein
MSKKGPNHQCTLLGASKKPLNNQEQPRTGQIIKYMLLTVGDDEQHACTSVPPMALA